MGEPAHRRGRRAAAPIPSPARPASGERVTILRLCPKCGATVDPATEGQRGPCRRCERNRSRARRAAGEPGVLIRSTAKWQRTRATALRRDRHSCTGCGATGRLEVHHVQPIAAGGAPFDLRNLVTLCPSCHHREERQPTGFDSPPPQRLRRLTSRREAIPHRNRSRVIDPRPRRRCRRSRCEVDWDRRARRPLRPRPPRHLPRPRR